MLHLVACYLLPALIRMRMRPDTLVVITHSLDSGRDWLPLWTGLAGAGLGILGTIIAAVGAYFVAKHQLKAQEALAKEQFKEQRGIAEDQMALQRDLADLQLSATVLSSNRLRWIEQVREAAVEYLTITDNLDRRDPTRRNQQIEVATRHVAMLSLLLNHEEAASKAVFAVTHQVSAIASNPDFFAGKLDDKMYATLRQFAAAIRVILKAEWERVKKVE